jgi:diacylglycerol kinase
MTSDRLERTTGSPSSTHRWKRKFTCAFRGLYRGTQGQDSFIIHVPCAIAVLILAAWLAISPTQWALLILSIALVMTTELVNSALEHLVRAIHPQTHPLIGDALDIASGAVLVASCVAMSVGGIIFIPELLQWWAAG